MRLHNLHRMTGNSATRWRVRCYVVGRQHAVVVIVFLVGASREQYGEVSSLFLYDCLALTGIESEQFEKRV